ncbi:hypothetical protein L1887_38083 [Cichorium endivia]|nr:hypothetical protein L1887_38083 [Cichorium endivia]
MAIASLWSSMATWSTPTVLFCVLNLVIATIYIASNFKSHNHHPHNLQRQLARPPSFLERVQSVNLSSFYNTAESHDEHSILYDSTGYNSIRHLDRSPSLLQRVKSFDFSLSSFYTAPAGQLHDEHQHESEQTPDDSPTQLARFPSILERVKSIKFSTESEPNNSIVEPSRTPSLLDRVASFKLSSFLDSDHRSGDTFSSHDELSDMEPDLQQYPVQDDEVTNIVSKDFPMTPAKNSSINLRKSNSERRAAAESDDDKEDVDRQRPATMKESVETLDAFPYHLHSSRNTRLQNLLLHLTAIKISTDSEEQQEEMLRGGALVAIASMWSSMATWSTPTVLFCVLNLVIATIYIISNFKSHDHYPHNLQNQLARRPSFLERVQSVNLTSFYNTAESQDEHSIQYDSLKRLFFH